MKKIYLVIFLLLLSLLPTQVLAETIYIPYSGIIHNATGEIWCVRQNVFELSTGTGVAEYDHGADKCIVTLLLDAHREPAEITSVDIAIKSMQNEYNGTITDLTQEVKMKTFWIYFILIFGGMINSIIISTMAVVIYIYPNLRFR